MSFLKHEKPTTTAAETTTTTPITNVTCYDCLGEMEDGVVTKGDENCFTLKDLDAVGVKDVGPSGFCEAEAWYSEENGVIKKGRFIANISNIMLQAILVHIRTLVLFKIVKNEPLKGIFRGGKSDAGDVSSYPQEQYSSSGKPLKDFLNRLHHGINLGVLKRQMMKA